MMNTVAISLSRLKEAVHIAFDGDSVICEMYDPNVRVSSIEEIAADVVRKIKEYAETNKDVELYAVSEKGKVIGYFVKMKNQLISFGISVSYRVRKYLRAFFKILKSEVGKDFFVYLWSRNIRATKWLLKNGLTVTFSDNNIIKLQCQ